MSVAPDNRGLDTAQHHKIVTDIGTFILDRKIGSSPFGVVYQGLQQETASTVAVKQISLCNASQEMLRVFLAEIDMVEDLKHPNILQYFTHCITKEHLYIIMEWAENGSLLSMMKTCGPFSEPVIVGYITQVLHGLIFLHDKGIVHRDIKAANILVTKGGDIKIADFGVALFVGKASNSVLAGSPYWMAPEIIDFSETSTKADIWSLACTVIELYTGSPPYFEKQPMSAMFCIVKYDFPPLPVGMSPELRDWLLKALQKEPSQRDSAKQLLTHKWIVDAGKM